MNTSPDEQKPQETDRSEPAPEQPQAGGEAKPRGKGSRFAGLQWLRPVIPALLLLAAGLGLMALLGVAQRAGWLEPSSGGAVETSQTAGVEYLCPMHPQIRQSTPGRCPICGMPLEPVTGDSSALDKLAVKIDPAARRVANIQTAKVEYRPINRTIRAVGAIDYDESRLATITTYVAGRVEELFADYTGVRVRKGDRVAVLYSPELYAAQVEFLEAKRAMDSARRGGATLLRDTQRDLLAGAEQKLSELGMTDEQIRELEKAGEAETRVAIHAPMGGTVIEKMAVEGQYLKTGEAIYRTVDLSRVWLMLELFPEDASSIRYGQLVEAEVQSLPGRVFTGRVAFIDPEVDRKTRTVGVRVEMLNESGQLRPGDYATARIRVPIGPKGNVYDADLAGKWISPRHPQIIREEAGTCPICGIELVPTAEFGYAEEPVERPEALVIPRSAVLVAGQNSVVYVETEPGRFEIRPVTLGPVTDQHAVILEGLEVGEEVATSGNFLIDSQMQLSGKPSLIDPTKAKTKSKDRGPLELDQIEVEAYAGKTGADLERMYRAYFAIAATLAGDQPVSESEVAALLGAAESLVEGSELPEEQADRLKVVLEKAAHLHHQEIGDARESFKPVSQAVIRLAASSRGADAERQFLHFYCPMESGGDWLQPTEPLANPYYGSHSHMLRCGEQRHVLPVKGAGTHTHAGESPKKLPEKPPASQKQASTGAAGHQH